MGTSRVSTRVRRQTAPVIDYPRAKLASATTVLFNKEFLATLATLVLHARDRATMLHRSLADSYPLYNKSVVVPAALVSADAAVVDRLKALQEEADKEERPHFIQDDPETMAEHLKLIQKKEEEEKEEEEEEEEVFYPQQDLDSEE